jgi:Phosphoenolpyruvate phosphomutase
MPLPTADKRASFCELHEGGCFVIPNPFDIGTAKALEYLGFKAIASTSAGFAWTIGNDVYGPYFRWRGSHSRHLRATSFYMKASHGAVRDIGPAVCSDRASPLAYGEI